MTAGGTKGLFIPIALVLSILGVVVAVMLYLGDLQSNTASLNRAVDSLVAVSAIQETRMRSVEDRSGRNEERSMANQIAIDERLRRIEATLERLEARSREHP